MRDDQPSPSALLITAPSDDVRCYDLCVTLPRLRLTASRYTTVPWVRITANCLTEDVTLAAGIKVLHREES